MKNNISEANPLKVVTTKNSNLMGVLFCCVVVHCCLEMLPLRSPTRPLRITSMSQVRKQAAAHKLDWKSLLIAVFVHSREGV